MDITLAEIDALIADAAADLPPDVMARVVAARDAIVADPDLGVQDVLDILNPAATAATMNAAQQDRLQLARDAATAAGTTITHTVLPGGAVLLVDTDPTNGEMVAAIIDRAGDLTL